MSSLEVNPSSALASPVESAAPSEIALSPGQSETSGEAASLGSSAQAREPLESPPLEGRLRRARTGPLRTLLVLTGIALLGWIGRGLLALLGYRHEVTLARQRGHALELRGRRSLLGIALGETRELLPWSAIRRVSLVGDSALWAVLAALAVLLVVGASATVLLLWGIVGRQPSWIALAAAVVALGLLLDGAAYLWVRRSRTRGRATLELDAIGRRYHLTRVGERAAQRFLDKLRGEPKLG